MCPRTKKQFAEMRSKSREKILEAALELFAQESFHGATVSKLARKAGVSKGLIYNYFDSKEDLLLRLFDHLLAVSEADMMPDAALPAAERFRMITEASFALIESQDKHWRFATTIIVQPDVQAIIHDYSVQVVENKIGYFLDLFAELGHADPKTAAYAYGALMDGIGFGYLSLGADYPLARMKAYVLAQFIKTK
jgi:AcrR family transcriptional regulator